MRSVFLPLDISESVPFLFTSNKFVLQLKLRTSEKRLLLYSFSSGNSPFTLFTVNLFYWDWQMSKRFDDKIHRGKVEAALLLKQKFIKTSTPLGDRTLKMAETDGP